MWSIAVHGHKMLGQMCQMLGTTGTRLHPYNNGAFQGTTVTFPTSGCYELTGSAGGEALTFTVLVLTEDQPLPNTASRVPAAPPIVLAGVGLLIGALQLAATFTRRRQRVA